MMNGKRTPNFKVADFLPRAILDVLQDRLPDDPPDVFRTKIGLIHSTPILTYEYTGQLLDYFYCERDLLLRARMQSGTVNWVGWSILFYAMWGQLVTRNKANLIRTKLKLQEMYCRFAIVKPRDEGDEKLLAYIMRTTQAAKAPENPPPLPIDYSDQQNVTKAYVDRLSSDEPSLGVSYVFFEWALVSQRNNRADLVAALLKVSCDRLWKAVEPGFRHLGPAWIEYTISYAKRIITFP
ncbi:hypothetical protein FRC08_011282, partial [Ceratobasidium sp. 394]